MKKFVSFEDFQFYFDEEKVRVEKENSDAFVEFSMNDLDFILESRNLDLPEIDRIYDVVKDNEQIMRASLRGEWVEIEEPENRME